MYRFLKVYDEVYNCFFTISEAEDVQVGEEDPADPVDPAADEDDDDDNDVVHTPAPSRPTSSTSRRTVTHAESVKP